MLVPLKVIRPARDGGERVSKTGRCPRCDRTRAMTKDERTLLEGGWSDEFGREFPRTINMVRHVAARRARQTTGARGHDDILGELMAAACYAAMTFHDPRTSFGTYLMTCLKRFHLREIEHSRKVAGDVSFDSAAFVINNWGRTADDTLEDRRDDETGEVDWRETVRRILNSVRTARQRLGLTGSQQWNPVAIAREERFVRMRYGLGGGGSMSLEEIARAEGITKERVRQVISQWVYRARALFEECP